MMAFNTGDVVKKTAGDTFSNGNLTATVDNLNKPSYVSEHAVWLKETQSWLSVDKVELVRAVKTSLELVIAEETKKLTDLAKQFDAQKKIVDHLTTAKALKGGQNNE